MLTASTEAEARTQLSTLPHACGDVTFAPGLSRSQDAQGTWLVFRGACPRCAEQREERFFARAPPRAPAPERAPGDHFYALGGGREEADLYGVPAAACSACDGAGQYLGVTGDYSTGMVTCGHCAGTGRAP